MALNPLPSIEKEWQIDFFEYQTEFSSTLATGDNINAFEFKLEF